MVVQTRSVVHKYNLVRCFYLLITTSEHTCVFRACRPLCTVARHGRSTSTNEVLASATFRPQATSSDTVAVPAIANVVCVCERERGLSITIHVELDDVVIVRVDICVSRVHFGGCFACD